MNKKIVLSVLSTAVVASMASSAFAAPSAGLYLGGDAKKFYSQDALLSLSASAKTTFTSLISQFVADSALNQVVYVNLKGEGADVKEMIDKGYTEAIKDPLKAADFVDSYTEVKADGTAGATVDPKKEFPTTGGDLKVESVSAINAKQIEVKFNTEVDEDSATDLVNNYFIRKSDSATDVDLDSADAGVPTAELQADGKTVVITLSNSMTAALGITSGSVFSFIVNGVETESGTVAPKFSQTLTNSDNTAPTFVKAAASAKVSTNTITLTFSEPVVNTSGVVKVNGVAAAVTPGNNPTELTVTTGSSLTAGQTYTVELFNFKDFAGNFLNPTYLSTSVTVAGDVVAPTVTETKTISDTTIRVTFDKAMNPATVIPANIRLLDGNSTDLVAGNVTGIAAADATNKVFDISIDNIPALPFNTSNVFNATLVLTDSIKDAVGNAMVTTNKAVSITKDVAKPAIASVTHVKASATGTYAGLALTNGLIKVKYNENVDKLLATATGIVIVDNTGTDVTTTFIDNTAMTNAVVNPDDETELVIPLIAAVGTTQTSFTLRLPAGVVTDESLSANQSDASVNTFAVASGTVPGADVTAPVVSYTSVAAGNVINLSVAEANTLDSATVLDLNNYRLDAKPLPAGTYITIGAQAAGAYPVQIHLPAGVTTASDDYVLNVSGIKDASGNTASSVAFNAVPLVDDVAPVLTSATLNADGSVSVGYSETLTTGAAAADFVVTYNGVAINSGSVTVTPITAGAEAGKELVTVQTTVDQGADLGYGGGDDTLFIEADAVAGLSGGDIVLGTGTYVAANDGGDYNLNNASTLKVATIAAPLTGADADGNELKGGVVITIK